MADALRMQVLNWFGPPIISTASNHTMDQTTDSLYWVFPAETTSAITRVGFRYGSRTGTPPTFRVSLQAIDTSGAKTGTVLGGGSPASATFTPPADTTWDGTFREITLDNSYTPSSVGEMIALVIDYSSGTVDGSNNSSFTRGLTSHQSNTAGIPYHAIVNAGSTTRSTQPVTFAYGTASEWYGFPGVGIAAQTVNTSGHRVAQYLTLPSGNGSTFKVSQIALIGRLAVAGATGKVCIWNSAGTELAAAATLDADAVASVGGSALHIRVPFTTTPDLSYGTEYYFGIEATSGNNYTLQCLELGHADHRTAYSGGTSRGFASWNGSAWTKTNTMLPLCDIVVSDITVPSGSGGIIITGE